VFLQAIVSNVKAASTKQRRDNGTEEDFMSDWAVYSEHYESSDASRRSSEADTIVHTLTAENIQPLVPSGFRIVSIVSAASTTEEKCLFADRASLMGVRQFMC
jgi:hypothetical protein